MASYCCFWKTRPPTNTPMVSLPGNMPRVRDQLISFDDMLRLLIRPDVRVVVIKGIGGSGKTWAAKAAYRASRTSNLFDEYIWVSLSCKCSMRRCLNKIAASLSGKMRDEFFLDEEIREDLTIERTSAMIKVYLTRRKFLLILDNAYFREENILEYLGIPHPQRQNLGSKIFVTTRTRRTEKAMEPDVVVTPRPLSYTGSLDLLREKTGKDISFGHDLIKNCYGMPLTIILLAGALSDAPTQEASSEFIKNAQLALDGINGRASFFEATHRMVKFGFHQLPSDIARHCLLYCLLFSEDQGIPVKELFRYWLIDGLLQEVGFDEANRTGKVILDVLINHGMVYLEDNDHVHMHEKIRETLSTFGHGYEDTLSTFRAVHHDDYEDTLLTSRHQDTLSTFRYRYAYEDLSDLYFDNPVFKSEHLGSKRNSLMHTDVEYLHGSPGCLWLSSLLLRGNYRLKAISEEFFCYMGELQMLDMSYTRIKLLPASVSCLTGLRMLLLVGCDHLEEIQHIGPLVRLEVLDASCCCSLKMIESGSFDHMVLLKILDLSETSVSFLTPIPASMELRNLNLHGCPFLGSQLHYGLSKGGAVRILHFGNVDDLADWMGMLWLPCGLTFQLSDRFGMKVSVDANRESITFVHASDAHFFNCLKKDSPLWFNCFQKFHIVISPSMDNETMGMDPDIQARNTYSVFQDSYSRATHFRHSIDAVRYLEINGTNGVPSFLDGILFHAEMISLKRLKMATQFSDLNISCFKAARELWVESCDQLESLLSTDEVEAVSLAGNLQNLWISNMENLSSLCTGVEDVTCFSCLKRLLIDCCPNLKYLFPSALCLPNLEILHIKFCDILERVFASWVLGVDTLPRLQSLQLWELPELVCVSDGVLPSLKNLKVRGCAKLRKIPVSVHKDSPIVTTIGEQLWWDSLIWDDENTKGWVLFRNYGPLLPQLATE